MQKRGGAGVIQPTPTMRIDEAIPLLRAGNVMRCKRRLYAILEGILFRVWVPAEQSTARIYGVANISGQDFMTDEWELTNIELEDGDE